MTTRHPIRRLLTDRVRQLRAGADSDRGSVALEVAILAPAIIGLLIIAIGAGRVTVASNALADAAHDAARAASMARTATAARTAATTSAKTNLAGASPRCSALTVTVDTRGFARPVGQPASVSVTLVCRVNLADIAAVPAMPGSKVLRASFTAPLDTYRGRSPA